MIVSRRALAAAAVPLFLAAAAHAQIGACQGGDVCGGCDSFTQRQTASLSRQVPPWVQDFSIPPFDPANGDLKKVDITATVTLQNCTFGIENLSQIGPCGNGSWNVIPEVQLFLDPNNNNTPVFPGAGVTTTCQGTIPCLGIFDGTIDFQGFDACAPAGCNACLDPQGCVCGSGYTESLPNSPPVVATSCIDDPAVLAFFVSGPVPFQARSIANQSQFSNCGGGATMFSIEAGVEVNVTYSFCANSPPQANPESKTTCRGEPVIIDVLSNDTDDNNEIDCSSILCSNPPNGTCVVVDCPAGTPSNCVNCPGSPGSKCIRYTPNPGFTGTDVFTYTIEDCDDCISLPATVTVTVKAPPEAADFTVEACRDVETCIDLLDHVVPAPGRSIVCSETRITMRPTIGTVTPSAGSCTVCYTPAPGIVGNDAFEYEVVDDNGCTDRGTVTVRLFAPPTVADDDDEMCQGDPPIVIDVLRNDTSSAGTSIECDQGQAAGAVIMICTPPQGGIATPILSPGCSANTDCPDYCVQYRPNPGFHGCDTFTYRIRDERGCLSECATVTVSVKPRPNAQNDFVEKDPDSGDCIEFDVLANDSPGTGCALGPPCVSCPGGDPCDFDGCLVIVNPPPAGEGTVSVDPVTCRVTFCPGPDFDEEVCFTYEVRNHCGCTDQAQVCIQENLCLCVNRRMPSSLLLFPEFDNRSAGLTLGTITNTNCDQSSGTVQVEIVFINKDDCLEVNRSYTLSPCDTLTFLTSSLNPNQDQGYFYAFAKNQVPSQNNPAGTPIVFNYLIGEEIVVNGITALEHAFNAVAFKGLGREGEDNDDDQDGIRDLNGPRATLPEYEEAPDVIQIPRFLGQDAVPGRDIFRSQIILVNLTGGRAFDATLDIVGYNDNEEPLSSGYTFNCWDKPPLQVFAPFTAEVFLDALASNDPEEILGAETRESGWLRIDGVSADSAQVSIADPAFYAVLVERFGDRTAADLPWELCNQSNGDLLPTGGFGDTDDQ